MVRPLRPTLSIDKTDKIRRQTDVAMKESAHAQLEFLKTELDISTTLADRARTTRSPEVRERNRLNARKAYDTFVRGLERVSVDSADAEDLTKKVERLRVLLRELGEKL